MTRAASYRKPGVVSVWIGVTKPDLKAVEGIDVLKGMCGVSTYDPDDQEVVFALAKLTAPRPVRKVIAKLSYAKSFCDLAAKAAEAQGIQEGYWALAQYDFAYHPERIRKKIWPDPVFLGVFAWSDTEDNES